MNPNAFLLREDATFYSRGEGVETRSIIVAFAVPPPSQMARTPYLLRFGVRLKVTNSLNSIRTVSPASQARSPKSP